MDQIITQPFSAGYELVRGVNVHTYNDDEAVMDHEMMDALEAQFGAPLIGYVDGLHYQFKPEGSIPTSTLAVPTDNHTDPQTLLIQR